MRGFWGIPYDFFAHNIAFLGNLSKQILVNFINLDLMGRHYLEAMEGVPDVVTRVLERIDALLDPGRVEEATMLASWRARYARAVTGRTAARWRDRLFRRVG